MSKALERRRAALGPSAASARMAPVPAPTILVQRLRGVGNARLHQDQSATDYEGKPMWDPRLAMHCLMPADCAVAITGAAHKGDLSGLTGVPLAAELPARAPTFLLSHSSSHAALWRRRSLRASVPGAAACGLLADAGNAERRHVPLTRRRHHPYRHRRGPPLRSPAVLAYRRARPPPPLPAALACRPGCSAASAAAAAAARRACHRREGRARCQLVRR